eukprot:364784-Chlamydomonas_euryale.AAC.12
MCAWQGASAEPVPPNVCEQPCHSLDCKGYACPYKVIWSFSINGFIDDGGVGLSGGRQTNGQMDAQSGRQPDRQMDGKTGVVIAAANRPPHRGRVGQTCLVRRAWLETLQQVAAPQGWALRWHL